MDRHRSGPVRVEAPDVDGYREAAPLLVDGQLQPRDPWIGPPDIDISAAPPVDEQPRIRQRDREPQKAPVFAARVLPGRAEASKAQRAANALLDVDQALRLELGPQGTGERSAHGGSVCACMLTLAMAESADAIKIPSSLRSVKNPEVHAFRVELPHG